MSTARSQRLSGGMPRLRQNPTTRLRLERLEDRVTPSLTAGGDALGQLLIGFQPDVTTTNISAFYAGHGLAEVKNLDIDGGKILRLVTTPTPQAEAYIVSVQQDPLVRYVESNRVLSVAQVPNDPTLSRDFGLLNTGQTGGTPDADVDADEAWDITTGSNSIIVAVIDSGVDYTHPDLAANMWRNPGEIAGNKKDDDGNGYVDDYHGYDFANKDGDPMDDNSHGTHVAGTIAMAGNNGSGSAGVNWNVKIMALKFLGADNQGTIADAIAAINYTTMMRNRGVDIRLSNNSWGGGGHTQALRDAIDAAGQAGMLFVASAGNNARDNDATTFYPSGYDSPNIISVASTDHNDRYSSFTNWGATSVDLAAPGEFVWSTVPGNGYDWFSGTSMAGPHVAGAAALVWSAFPNLTPLEVKARLTNSVDPIGHIGANASYPTITNGRLNVRNALLIPAPDNDTTPPAAVSTLAVSAASPWSVTLTWTASGDDGASGRAGYYDVRYSSAPITEANWAAATPAVGEPAPRPTGSSESVTFTGLEPGTLYYFAVKVKDNAGNVSALSNLAQGNTTAATFLLNDGAEGGAGNWTATDLWHRSGVRGHDSPTAWYFGQESDRTYFNGTQHQGSLTLATPIDLTGVGQALLRYDEWRQVGDLLVPLDVARVQVSRNGTDWTTVSESFLSTFDWEQRTIDLTPFVGGPVHLRFNFDTNAFGFLPWAITQGYEGWHVDDVQVIVPGTQPAGFSVNDVTVTEGHDGTAQAIFTVTRSSAAGHASVQYATANGSATVAAGDYVTAHGRLTFAPGEIRKTVTVLVNGDQLGDQLGEADESFVLNLSNPTGAVIADGQGQATIRDDEPRIHVTGEVAIPEGDKEMTLLLAVNLSVPSSQTVTVSYATADGTATAGSDYLPAAGTLTFAPGETRKTIAVTLPKDSTQEAIIEAFFVNLGNVSSNAVILKRGVVHIVDDDTNQGNHFGHGKGGALAVDNQFFSAASGENQPGPHFPANEPDVRIADVGGTTLGMASGNTIWLDENAGGRGWLVPGQTYFDVSPYVIFSSGSANVTTMTSGARIARAAVASLEQYFAAADRENHLAAPGLSHDAEMSVDDWWLDELAPSDTALSFPVLGRGIK